MSVSLQYQTVYCPREKVVKPATWTFLSVLLLLLVLVFKIWVKVSIVDLGYEIALVKKNSEAVLMQIRELELQKSVLLRQDKIQSEAEKIGLEKLDPARVILVN